MDGHLQTRLRLLRDTMPSAARRRTARGYMRTCKELTEHLDRARQLLAYPATPAERKQVEDLVAEIEGRRDELSKGGQLRGEVSQERTVRRNLRDVRALARLVAALEIGAVPGSVTDAGEQADTDA